MRPPPRHCFPPTMTDFVLALDAGTSSARAARFDLAGRRVEGSLVQRKVALQTARDGTAILDPADWLATMQACVKRAAGSGGLQAVGFSCFWHSLIGTDESGNALTPIYTWADSRCRDDAASLRREFDEAALHAETGCMLRASFWPAKLRWLRRTDPRLFRRVKRWMSPAEWLQWRLTGHATCALGMATGTGLFNPGTLRWSERLLEISGLAADRLLPVSDEPVPWKGVPWVPGIGDGAASNLGSGATAPGLAAINLGTSAALRVMNSGRRARAPFGLFAYRVDAARYLVGGAVSNAGNLHAWARREFSLPRDPAALDAALAARTMPDHGLTVLPFWNAERAPRWNEDATGVIAGLRQSTTGLDVLQALLEASYYRLASIAERIGGEPKWIVSGGATRSRPTLERLANILGAPVYVSPEPEASLRGAAVVALERLGARPAPLAFGRPVRPNARAHARHRAARAAQERLELAVESAAA